jgi:hypothetical protein
MLWRLSRQFATDSNRRFELHKVIRVHPLHTAEIHLVISILTHIQSSRTNHYGPDRHATYKVE